MHTATTLRRHVFGAVLAIAGAILLGGCSPTPLRTAASPTSQHPGFKPHKIRDSREAKQPHRVAVADGGGDGDGDVERLAQDLPGSWSDFQIARRVPDDTSGLPMDAFERAREHKAGMRHYSSKRGQFVSADRADPAKSGVAPEWEWLGPANIAGRGRVVAFDPRDSERIFTAGVSGGVWLSEDGGGSWSSLSDGAENINIGSLAIDPVDPDTVYAGTGELYRNSDRPFAAMWGQGLLRSRDGGHSFQQLVNTANDNFRYVADLAISAHDHRRIYAATNTGLWRSTDAGASFEQLLRPEDGVGALKYEGCTDIQMIPDPQADRLRVSCSSRSTSDRYWLPGPVTPASCSGPCPSALFSNDDAGADGLWSLVLSEAGMGRTSMAMAPSDPQTVYAVAASIAPGFDRNGDGFGDYDNGLHALWRSSDGGLSWEPRLRNNSTDALSTYLFSYADGMEAPLCGFGGFNNYSAGWYNQAIAVDPTNPDRIWVAGMDIYRSDDGGRSFGKASYWYLVGEQPQGIHADQHALAFHPDYDGISERRLFAINDGGFWFTEAANGNISRGITSACGPQNDTLGWQPSNSGLGTVQYYTGATTADGRQLLAGAQDNGTHLLYLEDGAAGWQHVYGGDGAGVAIDPRDPDRFYVSYQGVNLQRTDNGGQNFVRITNGLNDVPIFIMPYLLDPNTPDRLWAAGRQLWRSENRGTSWQAVSAASGLSYDDRISALAVAPGNSNHVLVANRKGIYRSDTALTSLPSNPWVSVSPRAGWVSSLTFDPNDDQVVYATYSTFGGEHVWRSLNGGSSWAAISGSGANALPDIAVHTLAIDPSDASRLFIGTDLGLFVSVDGGANWAVENNGFASVIIEKLTVTEGIDGEPPMLFAFTYGRGAWRVPLAQLSGTADYRIGDDGSGAFYDPEQSGHGWLLESLLLDGVRWIAASWYVYRDGEQLWMIGIAPVQGDQAVVPMTLFRGGDFPPDFDPADVSSEAFGELTVHFDDRDHGQASWQTSVPGLSSGTSDFVRLSQIGDSSPAGELGACHSGSWYDPTQSGHGVQLQVIDDGNGGRTALAIWYHYLDGQPAWVLGTGAVNGDHTDIGMQITRGAGFPPDFDPNDVQRIPWGDLRFTVVDANHARIDWSSSYPGYGDGGLDLLRITQLSGHRCPSTP